MNCSTTFQLPFLGTLYVRHEGTLPKPYCLFACKHSGNEVLFWLGRTFIVYTPRHQVSTHVHRRDGTSTRL